MGIKLLSILAWKDVLEIFQGSEGKIKYNKLHEDNKNCGSHPLLKKLSCILSEETSVTFSYVNQF